MIAQTRYHSGLEAERSAARAYLRGGYKFAAHRYRGKGGEIDLILRRGADVIFVEVKKSHSHDAAAERVSGRQIGRIFDTAGEFLAGEPAGLDTSTRFDVALVDDLGAVEIRENVLMA